MTLSTAATSARIESNGSSSAIHAYPHPLFHQKLAYNAHRIATTATLAILNEAVVA